MKSVVIYLSAASLLLSACAFGVITGSISGTSRDLSGAVIPGVTVTAVDTRTGIESRAITNGSGFYAFPTLPIGTYDLSFQKSGFKVYRMTSLVVNVNSALRVDAVLQVGAVKQEVTVSSATLHVETTNTQMGQVITGSQIVSMPLNGRSYTDLLALQPGVVPVSTGEYKTVGFSPSGNLDPGNLSISGQRESANGFMVNGANAEEPGENGTSVIPVLDSIAQFRILTNNFDAEYGHYSGGLINVVTKSGTNQFHGDGFEFLRNTSFDARNFYSYNATNPATGAEIPGSAIEAFHQNQFGGTFGGPVIHDKVFFFAGYQGTRTIEGENSGLIPVLSDAQRNGDFSAEASTLAGSVDGPYFASTLSQKLGYPVTAGEPYYTSGCTTGSQCVFPNAIIPASAFSAPGAALLKYIPTPNVPGNQFESSAYDETLRDDKFSGRIDGQTRAGRLAGYYFFDDSNLSNPYFSASLPGYAASNLGRAQMVTLSDTKNIGPTAVNELVLDYTRDSVGQYPTGGVGPTLSSLGFVTGPGTPGVVVTEPSIQGVPFVSTNEFSFGVSAYSAHQINNIYQVADNYAKVHGTHTIKFGGEFDDIQVNEYDFGARNGTWAFDGSETGNDFADYLLGAVSSYQQGAQVPQFTRSRYYGLYGQDSWRARPNLTLNYGLRWDVSTPWREEHNEMQSIVPGEKSIIFPGAPTGWVFPGDPGVPDTISPIRYNNFAPRLGLAYTPGGSSGLVRRLFGGSGKSSIRAGYGIFYTAYMDAGSFNQQGDAPFGSFYGNPVPTLFATPFIDRPTGNSEGQRFPVPFPPLNVSASHPDSTINWSEFIPIGSSPTYFHGNSLPYSESYMFSFQRQIGANNVLSLSYVGTQGHRLLVDLESNPANPALCLSVSQSSEVMPGTGTCTPFGEDGTYYPITGGVINTTRRYHTGLGSNGWFDDMANSNYNALEASFRHQSGRTAILASYTYSKALDNGSSWGPGISDASEQINPINPALSKSLSAFDMAQNFVVSYSYELPFDKLFSANRLTRGWIVTGITRYTTGLPVTITEQDDHSLLGTYTTGPTGSVIDEPNFTPGALNFTNPRSGQPYFNTSLFTDEAIGQLGNSNRRFFTGPGIADWDLALMKNVHLTESKTLEFRAEFFNVFNHAQFNNPQGDIIDSNFGLVSSAMDPRIGQLAIKFLF
ncbi:MAG: carboxypeptidase regulatory-like domain-containing protein [Terriglobia bacterium]